MEETPNKLAQTIIDLGLTNQGSQSSALDTLSHSSPGKSGHLPLDYNPFLPLEQTESQLKRTHVLATPKVPEYARDTISYPQTNRLVNQSKSESVDPKQTGGWGDVSRTVEKRTPHDDLLDDSRHGTLITMDDDNLPRQTGGFQSPFLQ